MSNPLMQQVVINIDPNTSDYEVTIEAVNRDMLVDVLREVANKLEGNQVYSQPMLSVRKD